MFQRICLVHYHEIGLKGHNRSSFEQRLLKNIEFLLRDFPLVCIHRISGRLCVFIKEGSSYEIACAITDRLVGIPGVARVSCGFKVGRDIELINKAAELAIKDAGDFESFKVNGRRNHTDFHLNSMEINQVVGAHLCSLYPEKLVKMKQPDITVTVEVIQNAAYVYAHSIPGVGGLPVGTGGRVISLLSSGIDSPVATWRIAKRGATCIGLHFSGRPQTPATSEYLVDEIAQVLERRGCISKVYIVAFGDYQRDIAAVAPPELRIILYRRLMMKVAEALAANLKAKALVTGESLGQVASQTLDNIAVTDAAVNLPVLRPLIGTDKQEIIAEAEHLGSFEISSQDATDCCTLFMPRNPETHAKLEQVLKAEENLPFDEWIPRILDDIEVREYEFALNTLR